MHSKTSYSHPSAPCERVEPSRRPVRPLRARCRPSVDRKNSAPCRGIGGGGVVAGRPRATGGDVSDIRGRPGPNPACPRCRPVGAWWSPPRRWARSLPHRPRTARPRSSAATAAATTESTSADAAPTLECRKLMVAGRDDRVLSRPTTVPGRVFVLAVITVPLHEPLPSHFSVEQGRGGSSLLRAEQPPPPPRLS